jgi:RNA methyltransferase, TrmH family
VTEPLVITSTKNPRVVAAAELRDRRERDRAGLTLVDGVRELSRALDGGARVAEVFVDADGRSTAGGEVVERARAAGAIVTPVSATVIERLAYGDRAEGLVATVVIPDLRLGSLDLPPDPLVLVLEAVEKPGNLGAVLRSADGAGVDAVILADPRTDPFNPNAVRASLGTIFATRLAAAPTDDVRAWLRAKAIAILAARVDGAVDYTEADLRGAIAIVLGSEAEGLTDAWSGEGVLAIRLPMLGVADSLNVSIAAAVLAYEARRQRGADARNPRR